MNYVTMSEYELDCQSRHSKSCVVNDGSLSAKVLRVLSYQSTRSCSVFCSEVKRNDLRSWNGEALILGFSIEFQQVIPGSVISNENVRVLKVFQFDISCEFLIRYSVCVEEEEFYDHLLLMSYSPTARSFRSSFTRHFLSVFPTTLKFFFTKASVSTCI